MHLSKPLILRTPFNILEHFNHIIFFYQKKKEGIRMKTEIRVSLGDVRRINISSAKKFHFVGEDKKSKLEFRLPVSPTMEKTMSGSFIYFGGNELFINTPFMSCVTATTSVKETLRDLGIRIRDDQNNMIPGK